MQSGGQARLGRWAGPGGRWEEMSSGCGLAWQGSSRGTISCESPSSGGPKRRGQRLGLGSARSSRLGRGGLRLQRPRAWCRPHRRESAMQV